jgi:hypothetical protein
LESGRFEFKFVFGDPIGCDAFASLQFPGNENFRTVWAQLTVQLEDEDQRDKKDDLIDKLITSTEHVYSERFAPLLLRLLADLEVEYFRPRTE